MSRRVRIRSSKYLHNVVEQNHCPVKQRIGPMLGFKRFDPATITIRGIELAEKIKKTQFKIGKLARRSATVLTIWAALDLSSQQHSKPAHLRSVSTIGICTRPRRTAHMPELQENASPRGRRS
jgi:hypothetical protein